MMGSGGSDETANMYRHHFGLHDKPFRVVPSPKFLFASETHDEGRARMLYGIREARGFVVVTGQIGLGKTTILLSVLEELEGTVRSALIFNPIDTFEQLLRMIADEFGLVTQSTEAVGLLRELNQFLVEALARGEGCVLLIDEAQNLSIEVLEKIRLLSNLQTEEASLLQIVLVGQPELHDKLQDPRLLQLKQRVGVWYEIQPLDEEETEDYILHRLRLAGARRPKEIIPVAVCHRVHVYAQGIPRLINQMCDTALVIAFGQDRPQVGIEHVEEAARELQLLSTRRPVRARRAPAPRPTRERWRRGLTLATGAILVFAMVALAVLGWKWGLWSAPFLGAGVAQGVEERATQTAVQEPGQMPADSVGDVADETVSGPDAPPPAGEMELPASLLARMDDRRLAVESWRAAGRVVYSVHLASFRDAQEAREYAERLVRQGEEWSDPFFVEASGPEPTWYRLLGGGFQDRSEAWEWSRRLKDEYGVAYAQVARLAPGARVLFETPAQANPAVVGVEG